VAALVVLVCAAFAQSALAVDDPLVGDWKDGSGVIRFTATGPGTFVGHWSRRPNGAKCPDPDVRLRPGNAGAYTGEVRFYRSTDCSFVGDGAIQVQLSGDKQTATWRSTPPAGISCCSGTGTYQRFAAAPPAPPVCTLTAKTPQKVGKTVSIGVACSETGTAALTGKLKAGSSFKLGGAGGPIALNAKKTLKLSLSKKARGAAASRLAKHKSAKVGIDVVVKDDSGQAFTGHATVKLKK
jgi:hypothetical protein